MQSFDFYDTLATRLVADPADIFFLVGERLGIPEFRALRIKAEQQARKSFQSEVTFGQIYECIPLSDSMKEQARALELDLELSLLSRIELSCARLQPGDLIISDMYHDEAFFRSALQRLVPSFTPGAILVSGTLGQNKASGDLWKAIAKTYRDHERHLGDNLSSDILQARRHGLNAEHFTSSCLNRYEAALAESGIDGSLTAGASRATRLSLLETTTSSADAATIESFASVFGPVLLAFAHWIIRKCVAEGVDDIYFLARDGQLPFMFCSKLAKQMKVPLRCHYLYASRSALHLPSCTKIEDAESWLLDNTPELSLSMIAERAGLSLSVVLAAARRLFSLGPNENIPTSERYKLSALIRDPAFIEAFSSSIQAAYGGAAAYYQSQGLTKGATFAIVDVGWNGRMQSSLRRLLDKSNNSPSRIVGLYLCLSKRPEHLPFDSMDGFLADPKRPDEVRLFDRYRHVFEAFLSADHPTTKGFRIIDGRSQPVLGEPYPSATSRKVLLQHRVLLRFLENATAIQQVLGRAIEVPPAAAANLQRFLEHPVLRDGLTFLDFSFVDGQTGSRLKPISRLLKAGDFFRRPIDHGYWPEGSLSASGLVWLSVARIMTRRSKAVLRRMLR